MVNPDPDQHAGLDRHLHLFLLLPFLKAAISGQEFEPPSVWIVQLLQKLMTPQGLNISYFEFLLPLVFLCEASQDPSTQFTHQGHILKRRMLN